MIVVALGLIVCTLSGAHGAANAVRPSPPRHREGMIGMAAKSVVDATERRCIRCGVSKPVEHFPWSTWRVRADGVTKRYRITTCKPCVAARQRTSASIKASKAAYQRRYRLRDLNAFKQKKRESRRRHLATHNARGKRWSEANREKRRLIVLACEQARRVAGWRRTTTELKRTIAETLELARIGDHYLDAYTGELLTEPTIDHIVPVSAGGTHDADNLCVTSRSTNSSKHTTPLLLWLVQRRAQL